MQLPKFLINNGSNEEVSKMETRRDGGGIDKGHGPQEAILTRR